MVTVDKIFNSLRGQGQGDWNKQDTINVAIGAAALAALAGVGMMLVRGGSAAAPMAVRKISASPVSAEMQAVLNRIDAQIATGRPSNVLYSIPSPEGSMRMRIIVRHTGRMQLGFFSSPAGVAACYEGPSTATRVQFLEELAKVAEKHGLSIRMNMGSRINGQSAVDFFANV